VGSGDIKVGLGEILCKIGYCFSPSSVVLHNISPLLIFCITSPFTATLVLLSCIISLPLLGEILWGIYYAKPLLLFCIVSPAPHHHPHIIVLHNISPSMGRDIIQSGVGGDIMQNIN